MIKVNAYEDNTDWAVCKEVIWRVSASTMVVGGDLSEEVPCSWALS